MFCFYILKSDTSGAYYIGSTENFEMRLKLHNAGRVESTKNKRPWKAMFIQNFPTSTEARRREIQVKHWKSRKAIERLIKTWHF